MFARAPILMTIAASLLAVPAPTASARTLSTSTRHHAYVITGSTAAVLRSQMERLGPAPFLGEASARITTSYRLRATSTGCALVDAHVALRTVYLMPAWTPPADADAGLEDQFTVFHDALTVHEHGHGFIALTEARRLASAMLHLKHRSTCAALSRAMDATTRRALAAGNARQRQYDRRTRHGITQGAEFEGA